MLLHWTAYTFVTTIIFNLVRIIYVGIFIYQTSSYYIKVTLYTFIGEYGIRLWLATLAGSLSLPFGRQNFHATSSRLLPQNTPMLQLSVVLYQSHNLCISCSPLNVTILILLTRIWKTKTLSIWLVTAWASSILHTLVLKYEGNGKAQSPSSAVLLTIECNEET